VDLVHRLWTGRRSTGPWWTEVAWRRERSGALLVRERLGSRVLTHGGGGGARAHPRRKKTGGGLSPLRGRRKARGSSGARGRGAVRAGVLGGLYRGRGHRGGVAAGGNGGVMALTPLKVRAG
jgi:hypothetical protein